MTADRALRVELVEALNVGADTAVTPNLLALNIQRRTDAVKAIAAFAARRSVLLIDIVRAVARLPVAVLRQIAVVRCVAARVTSLA